MFGLERFRRKKKKSYENFLPPAANSSDSSEQQASVPSFGLDLDLGNGTIGPSLRISDHFGINPMDGHLTFHP